MNIAKQLNKKLDEIIEMRAELARMKEELDDDAKLTNMQTGEPQTKAEAIELVEDLITDLYKEIKKLTNNGENIKNVFNNDYYVNDTMQDREIVNEKKQVPNNSIKNKSDLNNIDDPLAMGSAEWYDHMKANHPEEIGDGSQSAWYKNANRSNISLHLNDLTREEVVAIKRLLDSMRNKDEDWDVPF
tara:strand:- start:111 stop:671 length:561 start_codon:yes stop_codon:yes gene_type:complete